MSKRCRTCGKIIYCPSAKNIFRQPESILLHHIKALSGLSLLNQNYFPSHICGPCEVSLRAAIVFRERIIRTQLVLLNSESIADALDEIDLEEVEPLHLEDIRSDGPVEKLSSDEEPLQVKIMRYRGKSVLSSTPNDEITEYDEYGKNQKFDDPLETLNEVREDEDEQDAEPYLEKERKDPLETLNKGIEEFIVDEKNDEPILKKTRDKEASVLPLTVGTWKRDKKSIQLDAVPPLEADILQFDEPLLYSSSESEAPPVVKVKKKRKKPCIPVGEPQVKLKRGQHRYPRPKLSKEQQKERDRKYRMQNLICELCARPFQCRSNLNMHLLRHTGVKNYSCDQCPMKFYNSNLLRRHKFIHVKDKPYKCRYCDISYAAVSGRIQHERLKHTFYIPYKCTECDKSFATSNKLKTHMVCHAGVRDFHCTICEMSFLSKSNLKTHYRSKSHKQKAENTAVVLENHTDIGTEVSEHFQISKQLEIQ